MFGINGSFGMNAELTGQFALSKAEDVQAGLFDLLGTLPGGSMIIPIIFTLVTLGFLATSMDSASFTLAASATKKLDAKGNPNSKFRLVWHHVCRSALHRNQDRLYRAFGTVPVHHHRHAHRAVQMV